MIIENCCCHNQLPKAAEMSKDGKRVIFYQTNGDVTLQRVLFSVSCLAGNAAKLTLVIPKLDILTLRYIAIGVDRGWWRAVSILTTVGQKKLIESEMVTVGRKVLNVVEDARISTTSQMTLIEGDSGVILLMGYHPCVSPVDNGQPYRMCNHSLLYMPDKNSATMNELFRELTYVPLAPLRVHKS